MYSIIIKEYNNNRYRSEDVQIMSMLIFKVGINSNILSFRLRNIWWNIFSSICIDIAPVMLNLISMC